MSIANRRIGIEVEAETNALSLGQVNNLLRSPLASGLWEVERDHSLRGGAFGWEVKTTGPEGQMHGDVRRGMFDLMPIISHSSGTWRAAIHCHVDVRDFTDSEKASLFALLYTLDDSLFEKFAPARRESNFCVPLGNEIMRTLDTIHDLDTGNVSHDNLCKYTSINVLPVIDGLGTFEFRHMGTPSGGHQNADQAYESVMTIWNFADTCTALVEAAKVYINTHRYNRSRYMTPSDIPAMLVDDRLTTDISILDLEMNQDAVLAVVDRFCSTTQKIPMDVDMLSVYRSRVNDRPQPLSDVQRTIDQLGLGDMLEEEL